MRKLILTLLIAASSIFCKAQDTLYSNNICNYENLEHVSDLVTDAEIVLNGRTVTFKNLKNDSVFTVTYKLRIGKYTFLDGDVAERYDAIMNGSPIVFGILRDKNKNIKSLAISRGLNALVFTITEIKNL